MSRSGVSREILVRVDQAPTSPLFAPLFPPAGILVDRAPTLEVPGISYLVILPHPPNHDERLKRFKGEGPTRVSVSGNCGLNNFMCLLAKIATRWSVVLRSPAKTTHSWFFPRLRKAQRRWVLRYLPDHPPSSADILRYLSRREKLTTCHAQARSRRCFFIFHDPQLRIYQICN
jgi:hypothetical protein